MQVIYVECAGVQSEREFWKRYLDALKLEGADLFGCNLDALWDALEGGGPGWPGEVKIVLNNSAQLSKLEKKAGGSFLYRLSQVVNRLQHEQIVLA